MSAAPWWERWPGLLDWELAELDRAGIRYQLDSELMDGSDPIVQVRAWPKVAGDEHEIVAVYPDAYPWFRPEVFLDGESLGKHHAPFEKNLCLLDRPASSWSLNDSLAGLLVDQLPKVYGTQERLDAEDLEVHQAEPFSYWYPYWHDGGFVVDRSWHLDADGGSFEYALVRFVADGPLVGYVLRVFDRDGGVVAEADEALADRWTQGRRVGRWLRLDEPLRTDNAEEARRLLGQQLGIVDPQTVGGPTALGGLDVVAAVFLDEAYYGGEREDTWLFVTTVDPPTSREQRRSKHGPVGRQVRFERSLAGGRRDMAVRIPELSPLANKTVIVVGTGGVGGPSAIEFAKAQVSELRIYDRDWIEPATSVRYPLGYVDAGRLKVLALQEHLAAHYPLVRVSGGAARLGTARRNGEGTHEATVMAEMLSEADLLYDGTAEHGTSLYLCDVALSAGLPYVAASTTLGAWGARVVRFWPDRGPCYECLLHHLAHQNSQGNVPLEERLTPPADPAGSIRPAGCADATFTGGGFDVVQAAMAGVRLAVSTLCEGADGCYPPAAWNVAVLHFRDVNGAPLAAFAYHHTLERHPNCDSCRRRSG